MASACVKNIGISSESFMDCPPAKFPSYGWLSPRISFSRELIDDINEIKYVAEKSLPSEKNYVSGKDEDEEEESHSVASSKEFVEFEFRLDDSVTMLPADELFSDGKLVPLRVSDVPPETVPENAVSQVKSPEAVKVCRRNEISPNDPYVFSPRAPTCSGRWKELLSLKRFYQNSNKQQEHQKSNPSSSATNSHRSLKQFLHRSSKSSVTSPSDSSLILPLMKDTDTESISLASSRLSLSSSCSSSNHEHEDLPRLSLDSDKPNSHRSSNAGNRSRLRISKMRTMSSENPGSIRSGRSSERKDSELTVRGVSVDSPRMNSSGKIVFQNLGRSSSSPSSFNGGPCRYKHRGMERSYSANVRFTPVLNVPVCSFRGSSSKSAGVFGISMFSSAQQKKEGGGSSVTSGGGGNGGSAKGPNVNRKNRSDRA